MNEPTALCYPIREPFKFRGVTVKPPAFVQMGRDEAKPYIAAGVIGDEDVACPVPDTYERYQAALKAADAEAARIEAERQAAADAEAARLEAERQAAADAEAARLEAERQAAADAAKGAGEDGKTAKDGDTKTTAAGSPAAGGRGARKAER